MANATVSPFQGACVPPFLDLSKFPATGGYTSARLCLPAPQLQGDPTCCLPCPATDWIYPDNFKMYNTVAGWLNVFGIVLMVFMLISYMILPAQKTRSHYLSVCLIVAVMFIAIGFTIPLAAQPDQCFDEITPNDMHSSLECAFSGAFIVAGGLSAITWVVIRALSMNLQICWDILPGRKFFLISQACGWGIPAALLAATMTLSGVSFRFGEACHVNHANSLAIFWGPLLGLSGVATLLQISTFAYCIHVYLKSLWGGDKSGMSTNASSGGLPSYSGSVRAQTARAVYRRLTKVLWLQWRGLGIVCIILVDVVFLSVVFVYMDGLSTDAYKNIAKIQPWLFCLVEHPNDKNQCVDLVSGWLLNEQTVLAVLLLLSLAGVQVFIMLTRPSFFSAWCDFCRQGFKGRQESIFVEARPDQNVMRSDSKQQLLRLERGRLSTTFEMQKPAAHVHVHQSPASTSSSPDNLSLNIDTKVPVYTASQLNSPDEAYRSPYHDDRTHSPAWTPRPAGSSPMPTPTAHPSPPSPAALVSGLQRDPSSGGNRGDYFGLTRSRIRAASTSTERRYVPPANSFSAVKSPSRQSSLRSTKTYDPRDVYSRGGLALNPPSEAGESREELAKGNASWDNEKP